MSEEPPSWETLHAMHPEIHVLKPAGGVRQAKKAAALARKEAARAKKDAAYENRLKLEVAAVEERLAMIGSYTRPM